MVTVVVSSWTVRNMFITGFLLSSAILCNFESVFAAMFKEKPIQILGIHGNYTWPVRELATSIDGDIVLGALHMVHERSENKICGHIMPQGGIQALEVMLYTLDYINANTSLLPGIQLGVLAKDDCDRDIFGLEQAVDFIRGMYVNFFNISNISINVSLCF